jgi:hypothetical protein
VPPTAAALATPPRVAADAATRIRLHHPVRAMHVSPPSPPPCAVCARRGTDPGQNVKVVVDTGGVVSNRRLLASQTVSLPKSNAHTWEGKSKGSLLELDLGKSELDYSKPLFLSVLSDTTTSFSIIAEMTPPSSGGEFKSCGSIPCAQTLRARRPVHPPALSAWWLTKVVVLALVPFRPHPGRR